MTKSSFFASPNVKAADSPLRIIAFTWVAW